MKRDPEIIDLQRYRQAARDKAAAAKIAKPPQSKSESVLGSRPRAGLILGLMALVFLAMWIIPKVI
jgi:hypothetical protein